MTSSEDPILLLAGNGLALRNLLLGQFAEAVMQEFKIRIDREGVVAA